MAKLPEFLSRGGDSHGDGKTISMWCPHCRQAVQAVLDEQHHTAQNTAFGCLAVFTRLFGVGVRLAKPSVYSYKCSTCRNVIEEHLDPE